MPAVEAHGRFPYRLGANAICHVIERLPRQRRVPARGRHPICLSSQLAREAFCLLFDRADREESPDCGAGYAAIAQVQPFLTNNAAIRQLLQHAALYIAEFHRNPRRQNARENDRNAAGFHVTGDKL